MQGRGKNFFLFLDNDECPKLLAALWNHKGNEMDVNSDKAKVTKDLGPLEHHLASELEELEAAPVWGYYIK